MIAGFQKLTLTDYPGKMACIIFTQGCNFNCSYCQNSSLIKCNKESDFDEKDVFDYLEKRKKVLDGVVISGGEPTIHKNLKELIKKIKAMGYAIKLDTNGSNPSMLKELLDEHLIDYVAMDVKNTFADYEKVIKTKSFIDNIKKSINMLKKSDIKYEFRITLIKNYHSIPKIMEICDYLGKDERVFLQNFEDSDYVRDKELKSFKKEELINIQKNMKERFSNVCVRGL